MTSRKQDFLPTFVFVALGICCIFSQDVVLAATPYFALDLASDLDGQSKHSLDIGLLEEGDPESMDTVPPPDVSGFDFYVASGLASPWDRLSVLFVPKVSGQRSYAWTVIVAAPANQQVTVSWDVSGAPADVNPYFVELDLQTGDPVGELHDMNVVTWAVIQGGALVATTKAFEFRMHLNHPPVLASVGNRSVAENQALSIQLSATDPDGDGISYSSSSLPSGASLNSSTGLFSWTPGFDQAGTYSVAFTAADDAFPSMSDSETIQIEVTEANWPPSIDSVTISPTTAYTDSTLTATPSGWSDLDGDPPGYLYQWKTHIGNVPGATGPTLSGANFWKGYIITCQVTPWDGTDTGEPKLSNAVTIQNSPPSISGVSTSPSTAYTDTTLSARALGWSDANGDAPGYTYQWRRNGSAISGATTTSLTGANFSKEDIITCEVTPWDGTDSGTPKASDPITILNSTPSILSASISPTLAYTDTNLTAAPSGWSDVDGDSPQYRYQWKRNGVNISGATQSTLTADNFNKQDNISCEVTPWDGSNAGTARLSNTVSIQNSVPSIASVSISPVKAYTNTLLTAIPSGWADADGDSPGYRYQWKKNGVNLSGATSSTLAGSNFDKGDTVSCQVTPWDGSAAGVAKLSNEVIILDDPRTLNLGAGWSLVGISRVPVAPATSSIFGASTVGSIWAWDGTKYVAVTSVEPLRGYWVLTTETVSVQYDCQPVSVGAPDLSSSWNVFAVPEETPVPLDNPDVVGSIWGWDGTKYVRAEASLQPDRGYWVAASTGGKSAPVAPMVRTDAGTPILQLTLNMELSGIDKGYLEIGLLDEAEGEIVDPAPPASPDGFTCYIFATGPSPFNRLSKKLCCLASYEQRYTWTVVAQVPAGEDFSLWWDGSHFPDNMILTIAELDVQEGTLKSGSDSMVDISRVSCSTAISSAFAWRVEATCRVTPSQDSDGDLIPDDWEMQHFQEGACDPRDDEDRDGMSNLSEFVAGTDPNDDLSVLAISVLSRNPDGDGAALSWQTVSGRKYQVLCCDSLLREWRCLGTEIEGTGNILSLRDDTAIPGVPQRFYRVRAW